MHRNIVRVIEADYMDASKARYHHRAVYFFMPVTLHQNPLTDTDGRLIFIPVDRQYKPIGWPDQSKFARYEEHIDTHGVVFTTDPYSLEGVWDTYGRPAYMHPPTKDGLSLYYDNPKSRLDYAERMKKILKHLQPANLS